MYNDLNALTKILDYLNISRFILYVHLHIFKFDYKLLYDIVVIRQASEVLFWV